MESGCTISPLIVNRIECEELVTEVGIEVIIALSKSSFVMLMEGRDGRERHREVDQSIGKIKLERMPLGMQAAREDV